MAALTERPATPACARASEEAAAADLRWPKSEIKSIEENNRMSPRPMPNFFKVAQTAVCMTERKIPAAGSFRVATVYTPQFQSVRQRTSARTAARTPPTRKKRRMHRKSMHAPLGTDYFYFVIA